MILYFEKTRDLLFQTIDNTTRKKLFSAYMDTYDAEKAYEFWLEEDDRSQLGSIRNATFMAEYYDELLAGAGRSEALRRVQLRLQQRGLHPFYWAGFTVSGESGPLNWPIMQVERPTPTTGIRSQRGCACSLSGRPLATPDDAGAWLLWLALIPIAVLARRGVLA